MKAYERSTYILTLYSANGFGSYRDLRKEGRVVCVQQDTLLGCLLWEHKEREKKRGEGCVHVFTYCIMVRGLQLDKTPHCHQGG